MTLRVSHSLPYNVTIVDDNSLTLEKLKSIFQKTIEAVAHCDKKLRQKFVEQKEEFASVFEVLLYSQTGLFQHEIDAVHAQFERLLLKIEIYFPDMDVKELRVKLSRFFHNYHLDFSEELEQSKEELKLQDGEKHIRHIWVYFILILSGKFTVKQDDKGEVS